MPTAANIAMIATTIISSISVNPCAFCMTTPLATAPLVYLRADAIHRFQFCNADRMQSVAAFVLQLRDARQAFEAIGLLPRCKQELGQRDPETCIRRCQVDCRALHVQCQLVVAKNAPSEVGV